ncbi:MAG: hypothetical protein KBC84_05900, partial [Proteobacteria bacterium]|nr:hypothetical protein [Pseudomonadota bacterium]
MIFKSCCKTLSIFSLIFISTQNSYANPPVGASPESGVDPCPVCSCPTTSIPIFPTTTVPVVTTSTTTTTTTAACLPGQHREGTVCKENCYETSFYVYQNYYGGDFIYDQKSGQRQTCLEKIIKDIHTTYNAMGWNTGKGSMNVTQNDTATGDYRSQGYKWHDDSVTGMLWTYLAGSNSCYPNGVKTDFNTALTNSTVWQCLYNSLGTNYQANKAYINCKSVDANGNYVNYYLHDKSTGFGGGSDSSKYNSTQPACPDGTLTLDANCNMMKKSDVANKCGTAGILGRNYTSFWKSTPLSLVLDDNYDINSNISLVPFALNPTSDKNFWVWKGSEKTPLIVYDP